MTDMEPISALAATVVAIVFTGVFEGLGNDLKKQLIKVVREKLQGSGTERLLKRAEVAPTESNVAVIEAELINQMTEDELFAKKLAEFVNELERTGTIQQVMASNIKAIKLDTGNLVQKAKGRSINQLMGNNLEIKGDLKLGDLTQEGNNNE